MTTDSKIAATIPEKLLWLAIAKFLLLAVFVIALLLLGLSMAHHRFFRGGRVNDHGIVVQ